MVHIYQHDSNTIRRLDTPAGWLMTRLDLEKAGPIMHRRGALHCTIMQRRCIAVLPLEWDSRAYADATDPTNCYLVKNDLSDAIS